MSDGAPGECRLLAGPTAWAAQLLLALLAVASLAYKRHVERPQRPVKVWGLDVSKQAVSMLAAHICGMLIALIAHRAATGQSSECSWYFVAFTFDTTLGLLLTIGLHKAALRGAAWYGGRAAQHLPSEELQPAVGANGGADGSGSSPCSSALGDRWFEVLQACGNYGEPPSYRRWGIQLAEWVACVVLARAICGTVVVLLGSALVHVAQGLDGLFEGHPTLLLYTVMICCPLLMNICQVLIQDLVLKWRSKSAAAAAAGDGSNDLDGNDLGGSGGSGPSLAQRLRSLAQFHTPGRRGSLLGERAASLAKLGGGRAGLAEREASLLGPADLRSDAPNTV